MDKFASYQDFMDFMDELGQFHMELGLGRIKKAINALNLQELAYPVLHVVGTNGKGSTCSFLESLAREHGLKAGLYTSPHFCSIRERIRVDNQVLSQEEWLNLANQVAQDAGELELTYFEWITLMAMIAFAENNVDVAVLEAGLGGSYDATNAFKTDISVITPIGFDHEQVLGHSLQDIAAAKAGVIRAGGRVISADQEAQAALVLEEKARELEATLVYASDLFVWEGENIIPRQTGYFSELKDVKLRLSGAHQRENAQLALAAWQWLASAYNWPIDSQKCREALKSPWLPGRLQYVFGKPNFLLDGAHNQPGLKQLQIYLQEENLKPETIIFTCLKDKDIPVMTGIVKSMGAREIIIPGMQGMERSQSAARLAERIGPQARAVEDMAAALQEVKDVQGFVLVCGSLYMLADFFEQRPECLLLQEAV
jgi:dihydrofolate synthase/folylpolyglutamate synthase